MKVLNLKVSQIPWQKSLVIMQSEDLETRWRLQRYGQSLGDGRLPKVLGQPTIQTEDLIHREGAVG